MRDKCSSFRRRRSKLKNSYQFVAAWSSTAKLNSYLFIFISSRNKDKREESARIQRVWRKEHGGERAVEEIAKKPVNNDKREESRRKAGS